VVFNDLSDAAKLLFVIWATNTDCRVGWWGHATESEWRAATGGREDLTATRSQVIEFFRHCEAARADLLQRRRKDLARFRKSRL